jgi:hypothetical protein
MVARIPTEIKNTNTKTTHHYKKNGINSWQKQNDTNDYYPSEITNLSKRHRTITSLNSFNQSQQR